MISGFITSSSSHFYLVHPLQGEKEEREVAFGISSLSTEKANPAQLLAFNRNHWSIENKVHYVRDVTFDEDRSRVRKQAGPQVMASLRNLTLSMLRMAGANKIAQSLRACNWKTWPCASWASSPSKTILSLGFYCRPIRPPGGRLPSKPPFLA
jgi:hypothetical protein